MEFIQNIVYAPGSIKVVFKGSEKTAIVGKSISSTMLRIELFEWQAVKRN